MPEISKVQLNNDRVLLSAKRYTMGDGPMAEAVDRILGLIETVVIELDMSGESIIEDKERRKSEA